MTKLYTLCLPLVVLFACGGPSNVTTTRENNPEAEEAETNVSHPAPQGGSIVAAVSSPHRSETNRARDSFRHPAQTLEFFGLEPNMTVVELAPGRGWYTEVLAAALAPDGQLIVAVPPRYQKAFDEFATEQPLYKQIGVVPLDPSQTLQFGEPGSADMVLTFRNTHNWIQRGHEEAVYTAAYQALREGGVFGVVQHRAEEGADPEQSAEEGYVPQAHIIELAEKVGFVLEETSEINANPADTKNHPEGVWTLPPVLRLGEQDRATYEAIGESDRMTLRFRKPKRK